LLLFFSFMSDSEEPNELEAKKQRKKARFKPQKITLDRKPYWQVVLPSELRERDGKIVRIRPRRTFRNWAEAESFAQLKRIERKNRGTAGVSMDEKLRGDALEARRILEPYKVGILDAAKDYVRRMELVTRSETVKVAISGLLAAKTADNRRPRYIGDLRVRLAQFSETFGERKLADIAPSEIESWLRGLCLAPVTRNSFRARISVLFEYARSRGWVARNPVEDIKPVRLNATSRPGILEPDQAARLLEAASEETLPLFAGLRSAELERLSWKDIHWKDKLIEVSPLTSKTASRRFVSIQPNLVKWLEPYRDRHHGPVCPPGLRTRLKVDRAAAGLLKDWPPNGARHSFASYDLAHLKDPKKLSLELGHTRPDTLFRHYRELVKPDKARRFWKIAPELESKVVRTLKVA
jgi:integrase